MKRWESLLATAAGLAALLALIFVPFSDGVHNVAQFLRKDPTTVTGLTDVAGDLLFVCVLELLIFAVTVVILLWRTATSRRDVGLRRTYAIDDAVKHVLKEIGDGHGPLTVVGYSLSFAEALRIALQERPRPNLDVNLAVPSERYVKVHCSEDKQIAHRISHQRSRIVQWEQLSTMNHLHSIKVSRYECAPNLFAFMTCRDVIYYGRYPFENGAGGAHLLRQNLPEHRLMQRVDERSSKILFNLMLQTIDAQTNC